MATIVEQVAMTEIERVDTTSYGTQFSINTEEHHQMIAKSGSHIESEKYEYRLNPVDTKQ
jgi:hypothetical protein